MSTNYTISQYDTKYDNITGSGWRYSPLIPGTSINGFIYANPTDVTFAAHIKNFIEPCAGAHYYAQGFFNSNYRSASMTVNLNEVEIYRASNKRNGYICLGFVSNGSLYRHSDIGLGCTEDYTVGNYKRGKWKAFVWGSSTTGGDVPWVWTYGQNYEFHYTDTVRIEMVITVNGNTHRADCNFYANNNQVANCYINTTAGQMFDVDSGGPKVRFVRFMSLVPIENSPGTKDDKDYTYLKGTIRNLKLGSSTWDYSKIQYAWSVQEDNINDFKLSILNTTSIGTDADSIHIYHDTQTH